jgi:hypothetical protein
MRRIKPFRQIISKQIQLGDVIGRMGDLAICMGDVNGYVGDLPALKTSSSSS